MRSFPCAVQTSQAGNASPKTGGDTRLGQDVATFEEEHEDEVDESHRVEDATFVATERTFDGVRQIGAQQVVSD